MSDTNFIQGKSILAMVNDETSVTEMLQMMGVEPTQEIVNEAMNHFALNDNKITMEKLYDFLKQKSILSKVKFSKENTKLASVVDLR